MFCELKRFLVCLVCAFFVMTVVHAELRSVNLAPVSNVLGFPTAYSATGKTVVSGSFTMTMSNVRIALKSHLEFRKSSGVLSLQGADDVVITRVTMVTPSTVNKGAVLAVSAEGADGAGMDGADVEMSVAGKEMSVDVAPECQTAGNKVTLSAGSAAAVCMNGLVIEYHYEMPVRSDRYELLSDDSMVGSLKEGDELVLVACHDDGAMVAMGREEMDVDVNDNTRVFRTAVPVTVSGGAVNITDEPVEVVTLMSADASPAVLPSWYLRGVSGRYLKAVSGSTSILTSATPVPEGCKAGIFHWNNNGGREDESRIALKVNSTTDKVIRYSASDRFGCEGNDGNFIKVFRKVAPPAVTEIDDAAMLAGLDEGTQVRLAGDWSVVYVPADGRRFYAYDSDDTRAGHTGHLVKIVTTEPLPDTRGGIVPAGTVATVIRDQGDVALEIPSVTPEVRDSQVDLSQVVTEFDTDIEGLAGMPVHQYVCLRNVLINYTGTPSRDSHLEADLNHNDPTVAPDKKCYMAIRNEFDISPLPLSGVWEYDVYGFIGRDITPGDIPAPGNGPSRVVAHGTRYLDRALYVTGIYRHDTTTSVAAPEVTAQETTPQYHSLQGHKVDRPQPGNIYIVVTPGAPASKIIY